MRAFDLPEEYKTAVWWVGFFYIYLFYFKAPFLFLSIGQG